MLAAKDDIDLKSYEPAMRHLIDNYISADESRQISAFDDMTLVDLIVYKGQEFVKILPKNIQKDKEAAAEVIENNVRRLIIEESPTNPKYYDKMSVLLEEVIRARKATAISYEKYLKKVVEIAKKVKNPETSMKYPLTINTGGKRALYDNLNQDEKLAVALHEKIKQEAPRGWRGNKIKKRLMLSLIKEYIPDDQLARDILLLVDKQEEY